MHRLIALFFALVVGAGTAAAQVPTQDPAPLLREIVRKIHIGLASQAGAPWTPSGVRLLVDPTAPTAAGRWDSLAPAYLRDDDVALVICTDACEPTRPAEIAIRLGAPAFAGDRHASVEVEARGIHPRRNDIPQHPGRTTTRYQLRRHGGEWIVVATESLLAS